MKLFNLKEFIEELLIPDLDKMIRSQLHYYAFSIICQAIEVMGSIYDQHDIADFGHSETRFDNALTKLFRNKLYSKNQKLFFEFLRGPLIHQLRPGSGLFIASEAKDDLSAKNHLEKHDNGSTILVVEQFYEDFVDAFQTFKRELTRQNGLDQRKVENPFIEVSPIVAPFPTTAWSKESHTLLRITSYATGQANL